MTVLVSYIPTPEGWAALAAGVEQATWRGKSIVVVNVVTHRNFAEVTAAEETDLDAVRAHLQSKGLEHEIVQVPDATDVADAILLAADDRQAELIVVGLRRRSAIGKALLGSNAQQVILAAQCPVLSVRPAS